MGWQAIQVGSVICTAGEHPSHGLRSALCRMRLTLGIVSLLGRLSGGFAVREALLFSRHFSLPHGRSLYINTV